MTDLPTGTVTFLFSDVEGSTRLLQQLGTHYAEALAAHQFSYGLPLRPTRVRR